MARGGFSTVGKWVGFGVLLGGLISGAQSTDCMTRLSGGEGWRREDGHEREAGGGIRSSTN